jgi:hypothetical protein
MRLAVQSALAALVFGAFAAGLSAQPSGWSADSRITNDASFSGFPRAAVDSSGNIHVVWQDTRDGNAEIYYRKLSGSGNPLTPDLRLTTDAALSWFPSVAIDATGSVHVGWTDERDSNAEVYYEKLTNAGVTVVNDQRITIDPTPAGAPSVAPSIAVDPSGSVHLAWGDGRDGNAEIYYRKLSNSGVPLSSDTRLTVDPAVSWQPAIAVDLGGFVHIVWMDSRTGNGEIFYKRLDNNGAALAPDTQQSLDAADSAFPRISSDALGLLHLVWVDQRNGNADIYYRKLDPAGAPLTLELFVTSDPGTSWFPDVAGDASGRAQILWCDDRDGNFEIYYQKLKGLGATVIDDTRLTQAMGESVLPTNPADLYSTVQVLWEDLRDTNDEIYHKGSLRPTVSISGSPSPGGTVGVDLSDSLNPSESYLLGMALGTGFGIPIGDGRNVPLNGDPLFFLSVLSPGLIGLQNSQGFLDTMGNGSALWSIPSGAPGGGVITVYFAFVTLDGALPLPAGLVSISLSAPLTIM